MDATVDGHVQAIDAPTRPTSNVSRTHGAPLFVLALALACFSAAAWFEGKPLWAAYNAVGTALALAAGSLISWLNVPLPRAATLVCVLAAMLHYVGGSLGGHFGIEGINGMYAVVPWWDRVTHFFGAAGVALLAHRLTAARSARSSWGLPRGAVALFAGLLAVSIGVGVELFEFGAWTFFGTVDQGFYSNTMMDLYDDAVGAAFGAGLAVVTSSPDARRQSA